jgi:anaerobic selenocysteine-containing dehydrogenase
MVATLVGDRILRVVGDRDHPHSHGYSCSKGRAIPARHHSDARLCRPRLHGEVVEWDALLDDMATTIDRLDRTHGPNAIAAYRATGSGVDVAMGYAGTRLIDLLGSRQLYSAATVDVAPLLRSAELVTGFLNFPQWTIESGPRMAIMLGLNPIVSGGYVGTLSGNWTARLREFRRHGGEIWVIDPRATQTAGHADRHLAPRPGSDVFILGLLVRELLAAGFDRSELENACDPADVRRLRVAVAPFDYVVVSDRTGVAVSDLEDLVAAVRRHGRVAVLPGTGITFAPTALLSMWLVWATMIVTGSLDVQGGLQFTPPSEKVLDGPPLTGHAPEGGAHTTGPASRPELTGLFGQQPAAALVDEIEAGEVRALIVLGGNPLTALPDPERTRRALRRLELLAVFDVVDNEMTDLATHVVATTWSTERSDVISALYPRMYFTPALVAPGSDRRHSWWILGQLGRRLGIDLFDGGLDVETCDDLDVARLFASRLTSSPDDLFAAGPNGLDWPVRPGWFHEKVLPDGRWRLAPVALVDRLSRVWDDDADGGARLIAGRIRDNVNAAVYAPGTGRPPEFRVSGALAQEHGLADGHRIRVDSPSGDLEGAVVVDTGLSGRTVWISHGWVELNVNQLTDARNIDPLTGQPVFTGIPVKVTPLAPSS